jgi:hypothetical protein
VILNITIGAFFVLALIAASVYFSWTVAFQPQGRYLIPVIPILFLTVKSILNEGEYQTPTVFLACAVSFLLSAYSFVFVALLNIPK